METSHLFRAAILSLQTNERTMKWRELAATGRPIVLRRQALLSLFISIWH